MCFDMIILDYKNILNLLEIDFLMCVGFLKCEFVWLECWDKIGVYDCLCEKEG